MAGRSPRWAIAAAIIATHALVLAVLLASRRIRAEWVIAQGPEQHLVYLVGFTPPPSFSHAAQDDLSRRPRAPQAHRVPVQPIAPGAVPLVPQSWSGLDWNLEAQAAADAAARDLVKGEKRRCDDSPKRDPWLPPCRRSTSKFGWDAEDQRAGFSDGVPYVRLGKRCVLVLGMVGCRVGKLPEANSHLFDHLHDADADRSSVPDLDDIDALLGVAPSPQR
jgi:hypothetical protein